MNKNSDTSPALQEEVPENTALYPALQKKLDLAEETSVVIQFTEREAFEDDVRIAGTTVETMAEELGLDLKDQIPKAARAYLELLLKIKDPRHEVRYGSEAEG